MQFVSVSKAVVAALALQIKVSWADSVYTRFKAAKHSDFSARSGQRTIWTVRCPIIISQ